MAMMLSPNFYRICHFFLDAMFDWASLLAALLILFFTWYIGSLIIAYRRHYPPGPFRLPLLGNIPLVLFRFPKSYKLTKMLQKNYGNVVSLYFGFGTSKPGVIVLSGPEIVQEALGTTFQGTGNPIIDRPKRLAANKIGLVSAKFNKARGIRRWVAKIMKNFGAFDGSAVSKIDEQLDDFLDVLDANLDRPWSPRRHLMLSIGAITHDLLFGRRPTQRDMATYLSELATLSDELFDQNISAIFILPSIPIFSRFFSSKCSKAEQAAQQKMEILTRQEIETRRNILLVSEGLAEEERQRQHQQQQQAEEQPRTRRSLSETPPPSPRISESSSADTLLMSRTEVMEALPPATDFVAHYLAQEKLGKPLDLAEFSRILTDMMVGALESVPDQIAWALFYLAHMPDEQERLCQEIRAKTKPGDSPGRLNVHKFVRMQAFLNEVYRHSTTVPVAFLYETNHKMTFRGYTVPADTPIWYSIYSAHYDRGYWGDPENFRVDRWLLATQGGPHRLANHSSHMAPFGIGNRVCPGEHLARLETFAYVFGIVKTYQVRLATGKAMSFNKDQVGLLRKIPKDAEFVFTKRTAPEEEHENVRELYDS